MGRTARFPEDDAEVSSVLCTIPNREDLTPEDVANLWFSKEDYNLTRSLAKSLSRDVARAKLSRHLDDTFSGKRSKTASEKLRQWSSNCDDMRGLERWSNRDHGESRHNEQFRVLMAVLEAQDEGADIEKMKDVYTTASKAARLYARMMGKADAAALQLEKSSSHTVDDEEDDDTWTVDTANTTKSDLKSVTTTKTTPIASPKKKSPLSKVDNLQGSFGSHGATLRIFRSFSPRKKKKNAQAKGQQR